MSVAEVLAEAVERHGDRLVMLCSFQKEESVLIDELVKLAPDARIVTIDTGVLFPETLATWRAFEERFGIDVQIEDARGAWTGPEHCCGERKVAALSRAIAGADAWITGHPPRAVADARRRADRRVRRQPRVSGSTTRSSSGPRRTCGIASSSATSPTTRCTTRATRRSAARLAPTRDPAVRAVGPG